MNILFLAAGRGSRFKEQGYTDDKPFISINGKRMMDLVIQNFHQNCEYLINEKYFFFHLKDFILKNKDELYSIIDKLPNRNVIEVEKVTRGAAETALLAKEFINKDESLIITDIDHLQLDINSFLNGIFYFIRNKADAGTWNIWADENKYSYCRISGGQIKEIAEKTVISNCGNTGTYYFDKGSDFVRAAEEMIKNDDRIKGEFYVSNVFNYLIRDGLKVLPYFINEQVWLGTPSDLEKYIESTKIDTYYKR